jgi:Fe-S cluster assembly scaffold protein SufB
MSNLKLNETPVRTSRNFNINNIKLENINIPDTIGEFNNLKVLNKNNFIITENVSDINISYGNGEFLINQIKEKSNQKIRLEIQDNSNEEIQFEFVFDANNMNLVENIEIIAKKYAKTTIIFKFKTSDDIKYWHNGLIRLKLEENAEINMIILNLMNTDSNNFISIENELSEKSEAKYTIVDFGGKNSITNYYSNLLGNKSNNELNTIYLGKENQLFDLNYIAELRGEESNTDIEVQGALKDISKKHFKGTIDFKKGCKKATGNENENCMLLSDTAKSMALPMLLCSEEDVEGNHSSSAGKIGEKELFYIMSRGFEQKEAMKLMVRAKFNKILEKIENKEIKEMILKEIDERLN